MPSLKSIRTRIASVKSTQKITRAMKLVAAAKLRRAQDNILSARPYAFKLHDLLRDLAVRTQAEDHPLLAVREPRRVMLVIFTSDRGMCGAFNTNILRAAERYRRENQDNHDAVYLTVVGRKGRDYLRHRHIDVQKSLPGFDIPTALQQSREISTSIIKEFLNQNIDKVYLIYNEFKSAAQQRITVEQLLPITPSLEEDEDGTPAMEFIYEPNKEQILDALIPMYIHGEVYRAALESMASEFGARMTAMENATTNASDMIASLTLEYNKARQASITKELLEIVAGAEALR